MDRRQPPREVNPWWELLFAFGISAAFIGIALLLAWVMIPAVVE